MMDYLINNFQSFAENYSLVMIEVYLFLVAGLFAYWLKPFTTSSKSPYLTAFIYWILTTVNNHTGTSKDTIINKKNLLVFISFRFILLQI